MPTANELVYNDYNFCVIGYSPADRPTDSIAARAKGSGLYFAAADAGRVGQPQGVERLRRQTLIHATTAILIGAPSHADARSPLTITVSCRAMSGAWTVAIAGREVTSTGTGEEPAGTIDLRTGRITEPKRKLASRSDVALLRDTLRRDRFWDLKPAYPSSTICDDCLECAVHAAEGERTHASRLYPDIIGQGAVDANDARDIARLLWIIRTTLRVAGSKMEPPVVDIPE